MNSVTTRTLITASVMESGRRRSAPRVDSNLGNARPREAWQVSAGRLTEVGQVAHEHRRAEFRPTAMAPFWAAAVTAMGQEGGEA
jgi:hypothetical protein